MKKYTPKTRDELKKLADNLEINLGDIDTSNITDMSELFFGSDRTNFNGIENWDVSNVKDMCSMFSHSQFNSDISNWDVSAVKDMQYMFFKSQFNGDISNWNVSNVKNMAGMFEDSKFNRDISKWKLKENVFIDEDTLNMIKGGQK